MKICDKHLYELEKNLVSLVKLQELVKLYQSKQKCVCCNETNHENCCQTGGIANFADYTRLNSAANQMFPMFQKPYF